ncbi:MAG TPA: hypothetical protein QKA08_01940 [Candidatus Megaira endosymbiont of Nemacystus decipiens]|nr:hypothetical protein [Candidatus Megaera endosymbiont of Nemacystus decipiens]
MLNILARFCIVTFLVMVSFLRTSFASETNRTLISYFTDNILFEIVYNGGWYSAVIIVLCLLISLIWKAFREVFFSIVLAIFGLFLLIFAYEAVQDFRWIPEIVS